MGIKNKLMNLIVKSSFQKFSDRIETFNSTCSDLLLFAFEVICRKVFLYQLMDVPSFVSLTAQCILESSRSLSWKNILIAAEHVVYFRKTVSHSFLMFSCLKEHHDCFHATDTTILSVDNALEASPVIRDKLDSVSSTSRSSYSSLSQ